ncbi:unnamed protein product [Boreogadus saida]
MSPQKRISETLRCHLRVLGDSGKKVAHLADGQLRMGLEGYSPALRTSGVSWCVSLPDGGGGRCGSRGKEFGHDVDFLLSTPEQGKEETLLLSLVDSLRRQGFSFYAVTPEIGCFDRVWRQVIFVPSFWK